MTDDRAGPPRRSALPRVAAVGTVVVAVVTVAAAVGGGSGDRSGDATAGVALPPSAVTLGLDALVGAFLAVASVVGALALWALLTSRRAPRRRWPRERAFAAALLLGAVMLAYVWLLESVDLSAQLGGLTEEWEVNERLEALRTSTDQAEEVAEPLRRFAAAAGALVVLALAATWWWRTRAPGEPARDRGGARPEPLADAVEAALADIDDEADPRAAILRCYARLSAALAEAGCPRAPAETPREHRQRAAGTLGSGAEAAARLVSRFERARYDASPISEADRRDAVRALREARAALAEAGDAEQAEHDGPAPGPSPRRPATRHRA